MINLTNFMEYLLEVEPEFQSEYERFLIEETGLGLDPSPHRKMATFAHYIGRKLAAGNYENAPKLFAVIESLLDDRNAEESVHGPVCTSFLETLQNKASDGEFPFETFVPFLGPKSIEWCKYWDELTHTRTPGLWK